MKNSFTYPIKAVSNLTGLSLHVIRAWEKRYNVVVPERTDTNRRIYSEEDVHKLKLLSKALDSGYSIGTIASFNILELENLLGNVNDTNRESKSGEKLNFKLENTVEDHIKLSIEAIKQLDVIKLENQIYKVLVEYPLPKFISHFLSPLLQKVGEMWVSGDIRIVDEHISTNVIRKILSSLVDNSSVTSTSPSILISTPKGQLHELGALIIAVLASSDGWRVTYLGPDLPAEEIAAAVIRLNPNLIAVSIVYPHDKNTLDQEMQKMKRFLNGRTNIIAGGRSVYYYQEILDSMDVKIVDDLTEFRHELEKVQINKI